MRSKNALTTPLKHLLSRANGQYSIDTNACDAQVECVLRQTQDDGTDRPVGYSSQALSDRERKLPITHKK